MSADECRSCGLPDPYDGDGDGIGSCECARRETCDGPPLECLCGRDSDDPYLWECCDVPDCSCDTGRTVETIAPAGGVL